MRSQIVIIHRKKRKVHNNIDYTDQEIRDIFKSEYAKQEQLFFKFSRFLGRKRMSEFLHVETGADSNSQSDVSGVDQVQLAE